mmetsp:Transcript_6480/g.18575  ORF Transcript_6480/g.18575 Transcript_6480/m.18575 type:complete len:88 (-) Transcript_6480:42-305(-)
MGTTGYGGPIERSLGERQVQQRWQQEEKEGDERCTGGRRHLERTAPLVEPKLRPKMTPKSKSMLVRTGTWFGNNENDGDECIVRSEK